jgi:hypothetical protein
MFCLFYLADHLHVRFGAEEDAVFCMNKRVKMFNVVSGVGGVYEAIPKGVNGTAHVHTFLLHLLHLLLLPLTEPPSDCAQLSHRCSDLTS